MKMKNSLKQLFRTPVRTLLFLLLLAAGTMLLVLGAGLYTQANQQIEQVKGEFTTIGTVEQKPRSVSEALLTDFCSPQVSAAEIKNYGEILAADQLNFEGANYIELPESRVCYLSYMPELRSSYGGLGAVDDVYVLEFSPVENITDPAKAAEVYVEKILYARTASGGIYLDPPKEGETISLCNHFTQNFTGLLKGKRYIATMVMDYLSDIEHGKIEYAVYTAPFSTQVGKTGEVETLNALSFENGGYSYTELAFRVCPEPGSPVYAEEVTDDFYREGGRGTLWKTWAEKLEELGAEKAYFYVLSTNSLKLLPEVHTRNLTVKTGREISKEEFETGAQVCMLPEELLVRNQLKVGDKLPLSLVFSQHGKWQPASWWCSAFSGAYSPINADGKPYSSFWDAEYEIVGTYTLNTLTSVADSEFADEMLIIPAKSVAASDSDNIVCNGPMNALTTSFQIPNGTIEEFDKKLHEAVPEVAELAITYDDNGYSDVITSLNAAKATAFLLFAAGALAAFAIILLLLYFSIVREKKRTAIERSLGMTKRQCRVSLLAGLMVLTFAAVLLGSVCGAAAMNHTEFLAQEETVDADYSTEYSLWASESNSVDYTAGDAAAPAALFLVIPLALLAAVFVQSLLLVNHSLKIDPILLLSDKGE